MAQSFEHLLGIQSTEPDHFAHAVGGLRPERNSDRMVQSVRLRREMIVHMARRIGVAIIDGCPVRRTWLPQAHPRPAVRRGRLRAAIRALLACWRRA